MEDGTIEIANFLESISTDIELPAVIDGKSVTSIGDSAFSNCSNLTAIILPDSVTNMESGIFFDCEKLKSIKIPDGVTSI